MAVQTNNRRRWRYTDRKGNHWAISAKVAYVDHATDGSKYGGQAAASSIRRIPKDLKPRRVKMTAAGHEDKWVIAYSVDADIYTTPGTTLTLNDLGADVVYSASDIVREEKYRDTTTDAD